VKACPAPKAPKNGAVMCSSDDYIIDTECVFSCLPGYTLIGSRHRNCLPLARWDGLHTTCKRESSAFYKQRNLLLRSLLFRIGSWLPTLQDNTLVPSSKFFNSKKNLFFLWLYLNYVLSNTKNGKFIKSRVYHKLIEPFLHSSLKVDLCA